MYIIFTKSFTFMKLFFEAFEAWINNPRLIKQLETVEITEVHFVVSSFAKDNKSNGRPGINYRRNHDEDCNCRAIIRQQNRTILHQRGSRLCFETFDRDYYLYGRLIPIRRYVNRREICVHFPSLHSQNNAIA